MRKILAVLGGLFIAFSVLQVPVILAATGTTIIPSVDKSIDCDQLTKDVEEGYALESATGETDLDFIVSAYGGTESSNPDVSAYISCSIKTGRIHLYIIPYIIRYLAEFGIGIAATVSMLFIVIGGFQYLTGPLTQNKEQGKKTITYALIGLVLTLSAWVIVNIVQVFVTS